MAISRTVAKPLCTAAEFALANESFPPHITQLSEKDLRQRIARTRKLRDKYADLSKKQAREVLGRAAPTSKRAATANHGTVTKRDFFSETLDRFEKKLEIRQRAAARNSAKAALNEALERKQGTKGGAPKSRTAGKGMKKASNRKAKAFPNLKTMRGSTRAAHARSQAKRDNRGR